MNAGVSLITAILEIAIAAEFAIATRACKKSDSDPLTDRPALDTGTKSVDTPNDLMPRNAREIDRKEPFHSGRIRMAAPTRLDSDPQVARTGIQKRLTYFGKLPRF